MLPRVSYGFETPRPPQFQPKLEEALEITEERMAEIGLPNFGPSFKVSCENHGGPMISAVQQWDAKAKKWSLITDFTGADMEVIDALIKEDSAAYAAENNIAERCN